MPQTPNYKKVGAHNMTAKHNFAKLVTLDKFSPSNVFPPFGNHNSCSLENFFFNIFILT